MQRVSRFELTATVISVSMFAESEQRRTVGVARERRKLEADKDEDDTVQEEDEHVPESLCLEPGTG